WWTGRRGRNKGGRNPVSSRNRVSGGLAEQAQTPPIRPGLRSAFVGSGMPSDDTVPCPYCGRPVYEDAERCPYCENYISSEDAPSRRPWWIVAVAMVCLAVVVGWVGGC